MGHTRGGSTIRGMVDQEEKTEGRDRREKKERQREDGYRRSLGSPGGKRTRSGPHPVPIQLRRRLAPGSTRVSLPCFRRSVAKPGTGVGHGERRGRWVAEGTKRAQSSQARMGG
ncbi:hypothetical protein NDU88_002301 [Pleurodeles waltl]|uniref:Uncharacterized protein n=1 Tax=Pleurodeles waltl TaxID=8319 RepID=A0AAV7UV67_PLEWA|nr:hypothetical protein NDU88_002301 [Pleurodeles waltl]